MYEVTDDLQSSNVRMTPVAIILQVAIDRMHRRSTYIYLGHVAIQQKRQLGVNEFTI